MSEIDILKAAEDKIGSWPSNMPGLVNLGAEAYDIAGALPDGVHRLEGSAWQFVVEGGKVISAVREDMRAFWREDHDVYQEDAEGDPPPPSPTPEPGGRIRVRPAKATQ